MRLCRCTQLSLEGAHLHFLASFCCLTPQSSQLTGKAANLQVQPAREAEMTVILPLAFPTWLWAGCDSPSHLLHGNSDTQYGPDSDLLWHPNMRIRVGTPPGRRPLRTPELDDAEEGDQERVSTPRGVMAELFARNIAG